MSPQRRKEFGKDVMTHPPTRSREQQLGSRFSSAKSETCGNILKTVYRCQHVKISVNNYL